MNKRVCPYYLILLLGLLPGMQTFVAVHMEWCPEITYPLLKGVMILLPIIVLKKMGRSREEILVEIGMKRTWCISGLAVGGAMAIAIIGLCTLTGIHKTIDSKFLTDKLQNLEITEYYWHMAVVLSLGNSLFEEYYWRGFLVGLLNGRTGNRILICLLGGLFFGIHHIFATLWIGNLLLTMVAVSATIIAGGIWTLMRVRGVSNIDCWVSHIMADLAVFYIGYQILQEVGN